MVVDKNGPYYVWLLYLKFRKRWTFRFSFLVDCTWLHQRECFCCLLIALLVVEVMRETRYCVSATPVRCMPAAAVALCIYTFFVVSSKDNRSFVELLFLLCFSSSTVQECGDNTSLPSAHSSCCHRCLVLECALSAAAGLRITILRHSFAMWGVALECTSSYWSVLSLLVGVGWFHLSNFVNS